MCLCRRRKSVRLNSGVRPYPKNMATLAEAISNIERRTGVPKGFFETLKAEDDWSFVIKSHALIEAACAEFLTARFGDYELLEVFSRLELSNKRTGKIAFLKELSLLNDDERRFVTELSELRNVLATSPRFQ